MARDRVVELRRVPAGELRANPKNWRRHPASQARALASILDSVGYADALVARETPDGLELIDGHLRAETTPDQEVPVLVVDVDASEADLLLATLDPLSAMAGVDSVALEELLASVTVESAELSGKLADYLRTDALVPKVGFTDPDAVPPAPRVAKAKLGDLMTLGKHRLLCGDSTNPADVERLLGDTEVSLIATDPPYGVDYAEIVRSRKNQKAGGWADIREDQNGEKAAGVIREALKLVRPRAAKGCAVLVWHPQGRNARLFHDAVEDGGVHILRQIIWVKPSLVFGRHEYHWRHEDALYGWFEGSRARFLGERSETTVWEVDYGPGFQVRNGPAMNGGGLGEHPTQKPVELTSRPIRNHTLPGEAIYEPFAGSGSALIAAEQAGRRCFALEIDPVYVDVIVARWTKFTGGKPERERG